MGKIITKQSKGMSNFTNCCLVLVLTLAMSVLSYNPDVTYAATGTITQCGGCHGHPAGPTALTDSATRTSTAFQGSHVKHVADASSCATCHATNTTMDHASGVIDMKASISGGTYSNAVGTSVALNTTVTRLSTTYGACSGTSCHAAVYSTTAGTSPNWTAAGGGCGACHKTEGSSLGTFQPSGPGIGAPNTGGHNMHIPHTTNGCSDCHTGATASSYTAAAHGNSLIDVSTGYNGGAAPAKRAAGGTYYTCNNASCHANPYAAGALTTGLWGTGTGGCAACHTGVGAFISYSASVQGNAATPQQSGPNTGSHSGHMNYGRYVCAECHAGALTGSSGGNKHGNTFINVTGSRGIYQPAGIDKHVIGTYSATGCANACHMGAYLTATTNAAPIWGSLVLKCIDCHAATILRTKGRPGTLLADAVAEFGLAWGHKNNKRTAFPIADGDCIACHLEGNYTTQKTSKYHADGNIDLRDPDVQGETPITNMSGGAFTFQRFSTSYSTYSRNARSHLSNNIDNVITQNFCLKCHDLGGAANTFARSNNGGTGTATRPFGGIDMGITYTVVAGASVDYSIVNVNDQFAVSNSSYHPVKGPRVKSLPTAARLLAPYDNFSSTGPTTTTAKRVNAGRVYSRGVVMNCFDCHNQAGTPLTRRTIVAHGNAATIRGTLYTQSTPGIIAAGGAAITSPTFCLVCHIGGYNTSVGHAAGSAVSTINNNMSAARFAPCANCHFSSVTKPARPVTAADVHGFNGLAATGGAWTYGNMNTYRPVAFMRNVVNWTATSPRPNADARQGLAAAAANCGGGNVVCGANTMSTYTPGGDY